MRNGQKAGGAKRLAAFAVLALLAALSPLAAFADPDPSNDSDVLTISLTPAIDLGVDIDTSTVRFSDSDAPGTLSLTLPLGATAYFISPATMTVLGNFNNQEVQLQAAGIDQWTVDGDETANADALQLYALFAVNKASNPVEAEFGSDAGRHLVTGSAQTAGETQGSESNLRASNRYEIANGDMTDGADVDNLTVGTVRQLWLRLDLPPLSGVATEQRVVLTVTAVNGRTN
jgi:hypothetical protein